MRTHFLIHVRSTDMPKQSSPKYADRATLRWLGLQRSLFSTRSYQQAGRNRQLCRIKMHTEDQREQTPASWPAMATNTRTNGSAPIATNTIGQATPARVGKVSKPSNVYKVNLLVALEWKLEEYTAVLVFIHNLVKEMLDRSVSMSKQRPGTMLELRQRASTEYPILMQYEDEWVTIEFVRRYLKNTSTRSRKK